MVNKEEYSEALELDMQDYFESTQADLQPDYD